MNAERTAIARKAFAYVLLKTAVGSKPEHFYPLTAEGKFPYYMPEQIFQSFAEVDERVRREEERGHVCRFRLYAHWRTTKGRFNQYRCETCGNQFEARRTVAPCPHDFEALTGYLGPDLPRLFECKHCGLRRRRA